MAKIQRNTQKVFAGNASNNGQFGSAQVGTKLETNDLATLQALAAFLEGWSSATLSGENLPTLEEMQTLHYITTSQIAYIMQEGVAEYDAGTEYHQSSIVKKTGTYELYGSLINTNTGNALPSQSDNASWKYLGDLADLKDAGSVVVPDATVTVKGIVEIATDAEVKAETATGGTGASLSVTPSSMKEHQGVCKAWVKYNNAGSIQNSYNVSSVTDNSASEKTINFSSTQPNANYTVNAMQYRATGSTSFTTVPMSSSATTSSVKIRLPNESNYDGVTVTIFGD